MSREGPIPAKHSPGDPHAEAWGGGGAGRGGKVRHRLHQNAVNLKYYFIRFYRYLLDFTFLSSAPPRASPPNGLILRVEEASLVWWAEFSPG